MIVGGWLLAHGYVPREEAWSTWARDPVVLIGIGMFVIAYANGALAARGEGRLAALSRRRAACAAAATVVLVVALASPLEAAAASVFSVHMVQHLLLTAVAAPLLALSAPASTIRRGLPASSRPAKVLRWVGGRRPPAWWPLAAAGIALTTLSLWHLPALYGAALESGVVHGLEHITLLVSALWLWSAVLGAIRRRQVLVAIVALTLNVIHGTALGALLALSAHSWYEIHAGRAASWGIEPLADQQAAGVIMWVPTAAVHLGAIVVLLYRWLRDAEDRSPQSYVAATVHRPFSNTTRRATPSSVTTWKRARRE